VSAYYVKYLWLKLTRGTCGKRLIMREMGSTEEAATGKGPCGGRKKLLILRYGKEKEES
jgi:hypothetical protein